MALLAQVSTQTLYTKYLQISSITGGNSINTEQLFSTVGGLGEIYPSTSGGGGGITTLPSTISSFSLLTSSIQASTIISQQFITDANALSLQYPMRDPSTFFLYAASTGYIGIGTSSPGNLLEIKDWTPSTFTSSLLTLQIGEGGSIAYQATSSNYFYYTGTQQAFTIPSGTSRLTLRAFGAGGESIQSSNAGGGGAFIEATLDVDSLYSVNSQFSNLYVVVGTGGNGYSNTPSADFWTGNAGIGANLGWPSGGGFSGIFLSNIGAPAVNTCNNTPILVAGAGGGGGYGSASAGGAATWSGTAWSGNNNSRTTAANASYGGGGGSQTQGGITGGSPGSNGSYLRGGNSVPGAGAGYYGGGGGFNGSPSGGGGGGSSYVTLSSFIVSSTGDDGVARNPGGLSGSAGTVRSNSAYTGAGYGGVFGTSSSGSNGLVQIIAYQTVTTSKPMRAFDIKNPSGTILTTFGPDGQLAINKTAADTGIYLDVAGAAQFSQLVTVNSLTGTTITGSNGSFTSVSTGLITNSLRLGTLSSLTSINYNGLLGNYNNTVLAEVSTGVGTQEFLVFKGSSASDRVRVQTTGTFVVETGVSARLWSSNTIPTQSNATPAFIINASSNVGIQTATPGATLDVAGTGRFQLASTLTMNLSSLNSGIPLVNAATGSAIVLVTAITSQSLYTYDGITWLNGTGNGGQSHGLAFNGLYWIAGTEGGIYKSGDGINWSATSFTASATSAVAWNGNVWVVGGWYGGMWYSYDGQNWIQSPQGPTAEVQDVAWGGDKFVAVGNQQVHYSYDGIYWFNIGPAAPAFERMYCVAYNGRIWLIGGRYASVSQIVYSFDGITWFNTNVASRDINDIVWSGSIWLAASRTNQIMLTSPDGITWTERTNPFYSASGYITWNGSSFYCIDNNMILSRSVDGITWRSLGTLSGSQPRKLKARIPLPMNGAKQTYGLYNPNIFLGISTQQTAIRFPGPDGLYRNTVIGEASSFQTRFAQELVLFKGSTIADRIRMQTTGEIRFEAGVSSRFFSTFSSIQAVATPAFLISTNSNVGIGTALPAATLDVVGVGRFLTLSTLALNISTINGQVYSSGGGAGDVTSINLISTVGGLGQIYISTGGGGGPAGPVPYLSSFSLSTGYVFSPLQVGTTSDVNSLNYFGTEGNYNNTVLAEISTGAGTQELLVFKGSTTTDRVRIQTTGNFVVETGVSARLWNSNTSQTLSNVIPAFVIDTNSNVGIQTAAPATTLDVAGTGRFIEVSTITVRTNIFYTNTFNVSVQNI